MLNPVLKAGRLRRAALAVAFVSLLAPLPSPISSLISGLAPSLCPQLHAQRFRLRQDAPPPQTTMPHPPPVSPSPVKPAASSATAAAATPAPSPAAASGALPPSMLDQPAKAAQIELMRDTLSIRADNSSLDAILHTLSSQSGMKIEGLGEDERVFGSFGPGKPQDVISDLLNGTPYNVLMVGVQSDGAPTHLILTPTSGHSASSGTAAPPAAEPAHTVTATPAQSPFGIPHPVNSSPPGVRSPQEMFEELQAMHQKQLQQQ